MTGSTKTTQVEQRLRSTIQESESWEQTTQQVQREAQSGQLPENYAQVAETLHQTYQSLSPQGKRIVQQLPSTAVSALFTLGASLLHITQHEGPEATQELQSFMQQFVETSSEKSARMVARI